MDIAILIILLLAAIWGFLKGFVSQIVGIISLLFGVWCAFKLSGYLAGIVKEWLSSSMSIGSFKVIVFIIILIIVVLLGHLIGRALEGVIKITMLEWLNKLLGLIFSVLQAILVLSILVYLIDYFNQSWNLFSPQTLNSSKAYKFLTQFAAEVFPYLKGLF